MGEGAERGEGGICPLCLCSSDHGFGPAYLASLFAQQKHTLLLETQLLMKRQMS